MEGTVRASGVQMSRLARHDNEKGALGMPLRGVEDSLVCSDGISACTPKHGDMPLRGVEDTLACSGALRLTPLSTPNGRMQCIIDVSVLRGDYPHAPEHAYHLSMYTKPGEGCLGVSKSLCHNVNRSQHKTCFALQSLSIVREACHEQIAYVFASCNALEMSVPFMLLIVNVFLLSPAIFAMQDMVLCCW